MASVGNADCRCGPLSERAGAHAPPTAGAQACAGLEAGAVREVGAVGDAGRVAATPVAEGVDAIRRNDGALPEVVQLLHLDHELIVANKPAGLLAVPGRGADKQDCLATRVQARYADARVVHRLDQATSGLMLFARGPSMQRALSAAFEARTVHKRYVAIVAGHVAEDHGEIDLPLASDWPNRPRQQVDAVGGKPSLTRYTVLSRSRLDAAAGPWIERSIDAASSGDGGAANKAADRVDLAMPVTRLLLEPVTGRSHQLRVHLLAVGHPILGDHLYAPGPLRAVASRLLLHASDLGLAHPLTGQALAWHAPTPF